MQNESSTSNTESQRQFSTNETLKSKNEKLQQLIQQTQTDNEPSDDNIIYNFKLENLDAIENKNGNCNYIYVLRPGMSTAKSFNSTLKECINQFKKFNIGKCHTYLNSSQPQITIIGFIANFRLDPFEIANLDPQYAKLIELASGNCR